MGKPQPDMRRNRLKSIIGALVLLILIAITLISLHYERFRRIEQQRRAAYEFDRQKYSELFPVGTPRKAVEADLRAMGISFTPSANADLVKIGEEAPTWVCERSYRFVSLKFSTVWQRNSCDINDLGVLQNVEVVFRGVCL